MALSASGQAGDLNQLVDRWTRMLGRSWRWLAPLARRYATTFRDQARPRGKDIVRFLEQDKGLADAWSKYADQIRIKTWLAAPAAMQPASAARDWRVPSITTQADLARYLQLDFPDLQWFADVKGLNARPSDKRLEHYHYRILSKRSGSFRLIEVPKQRLKSLQRRILADILGRIPAHPAAHGFTRYRSIKTFAQPHVGKAVVLRLDLRDFFPSFRAARIQAFFRTAGYPEPVAECLTGICTNVAPGKIWSVATRECAALQTLRTLYARPHLPQGAPTSPALANHCAYRMDCRLAAYAHASGFAYTRYADDLAFSSNRASTNQAERFVDHVAAIVKQEGFAVHHRKTRIMRQQTHQSLAGLVVNQTLNVPRADYDQLKAILTNCIHHGPDGQNREGHVDYRAHLAGRVAFIESIHPAKGRRLRALLKQIQWR